MISVISWLSCVSRPVLGFAIKIYSILNLVVEIQCKIEIKGNRPSVPGRLKCQYVVNMSKTYMLTRAVIRQHSFPRLAERGVGGGWGE